VVAAALVDLGQVGLGQSRFADHLSPRISEWYHGWYQSRETDVILVDC
jgi:hypothetical protein